MPARLLARGSLWITLVPSGRLRAYLGLAAAHIPQVLGLFIPPTNLSRALLARCPEGLMVLAARNVTWSDWGDPDRIVRTLGRFDRRPRWLPAYASTQARATGA